MNDDKTFNNALDNFLDQGVFDDIDLGVETKYFDMSVGYNRKSGTRLSAKLDLTHIGETPEQELERAKIELANEQIKLKNRMLDNAGVPVAKQPTQVTQAPQTSPITFTTTSTRANEEDSTASYADILNAKAYGDAE